MYRAVIESHKPYPRFEWNRIGGTGKVIGICIALRTTKSRWTGKFWYRQLILNWR